MKLITAAIAVVASVNSLLGTLIGVVFKEWKGCRHGTYLGLALALGLLIAGTLLLDYGTYLGTQTAK